MLLKEARENYYFHTGKVSDIVRQLALGGIAIIWLFHAKNGETVVVPRTLLVPAALLVFGLAFDLLQYACGSACWGVFQWRKERTGVSEDQDIMVPNAINWPAIVFFWLKVATTIFAYYFLLAYLAEILMGWV